MMKHPVHPIHPIRPELSLRVKLILSYLGVALGAILILAIVVSIAVQNYFASTEQNLLRAHAVYEAQYIEYQYRALGSSWDRVSPERIQTSDPVLLIVTDTNDAQLLCRQPTFLSLDCDDPALKQALVQALQGQEVTGHIQGSTDDSSTFSGLYISLPLRSNEQANGQIIGAMLLAEPEQYPTGFSPYDFLANVNQAILLPVSSLPLLFSFSVCYWQDA